MRWIFLVLVLGAVAEASDPATQEALQKTKDLLTNPTERNKALQQDANAKSHDQKIRSTLGDQTTEGAYKISAELMDVLVQKSGGDAAKMQELVNQLMQNPQAIEQMLTPAQREQIRKMASEIEKKNGNTPAAPGR